LKEIVKREYQERCVNAIREYLLSPKPQKPKIVVAPTAAGKSWLIAWSVENLNEPVLILHHQKELLKQNYSKLTALGVDASIYSASMKNKEFGHITFATIGSVIKKIDELKELGVKIILVDEGHLMSVKKQKGDKESGMLRKIYEGLGVTKMLMFSASPISLKQCGNMNDSYSKLVMMNRDIPRFWNDILYNIPTSEMVNNGFWKKLEYKCFAPKYEHLILNSNKSDFTEESLRKWYVQNKIQEDVVKCVNACLKNGKKSILVFLTSVQACLDLEKLFPNSKAVYGNMPNDEREYAVENFLNGNINIVFNMEVLTTGFDFPKLQVIIGARPTNSLSKYLQMLGRLTRPHEEVPYGTVVDLVGLVKKFGKVEELNFENVEGYGWGMFSGDRLLTGIRLDDDRHVTKQMIFKPNVEKVGGKKQNVFKFGKYQYVPLKDVPKDYLKWALLNLDFKKEQKLKQEILKIVPI
jgi:DNA repair protein RadD